MLFRMFGVQTLKRLFPSKPGINPDAVLRLEGELRRLQTTVRNQESYLYGGLSSGPLLNGIGGPGFYGTQPLSDNGLPVVPWATGTVYDRKYGKDLPLFWTEQQVAYFRSASRWVADTNPFAIGFLDLLPAMHIQKGCGWRTRLKGQGPGSPGTSTDANGDGSPDVHPLVKQSQHVLDEWRASANWVRRTRQGFKRWRRDGTVFYRFFDGKLGRGLPAVRFMEPEQVGPPPNESNDGPWSFGILMDPEDAERAKAFFCRWMTGSGMTGEPVQAEDVIYLTANVDSIVKVGLPDFFPVGADLERVRSLLTNMGETAKAQASIAWWEKYTSATAGQVNTMIDANRDYSQNKVTAGGSSTVNVTQNVPGTVYMTDAGRDVTPGPTSQPGGFIEVEQAILRGCGVRWNFPEYFSGDASNQNLASIRESGSPFVRVAEGRQMDWCEGIERPAALRVLKAAEASSRLPPGTCDQIDVDVEPPAIALSDKSQDEEIRSKRFAAGVLSKRTWQIQAGLDPAVEDANKKSEQAAMPQPVAVQPGQPALSPGDRREVKEYAATPPRPGLVFDDAVHRWVRPEDHSQHGKEPKAAVSPNEKMSVQAKAIVKKLRPSSKRAFTGEPQGTKIDGKLAGAIGEEILIQHLVAMGYDDAGQTSDFLNDAHNNLAFDLIHDHRLIEAKTGQSDNPDGVWSLKYDGKFTKEQEAKFAKMTPEKVKAAKKKINIAKVKAIHSRKDAFVQKMNERLGFKVKSGMMTVIINHDTKTADIFQFEGIHDRIPFKSEMAKKAYVRSVKYG